MTATAFVLAAAAFTLLIAPLLLAIVGLSRSGTATVTAQRLPWDRRWSIASALLYTLAFNLTFFIQELFLVLPKAFTPGLRPTLFHNNHRWDGEHPLASLFQGTGALATVIAALLCGVLLRRARAPWLRLFLVWMAYCGLFMALPQVVIGALSAGSDVGMAIAYLGLGTTAKTVAALLALVAMPLVAAWLTPHLLALADSPARIATRGARMRFTFQIATLPVLVATALIIPFRVPREAIEVLFLPLVVSVAGIVWVQTGAWRFEDVNARGDGSAGPIAWMLVAVVALLLVFQLVLRPGIAFY